jgi:hypothetical protein
MTDYQRGQNHMRDTVIAMCIGFQNDISEDESDSTYKAYQNVIDTLESRYGESMSKGRVMNYDEE